MTFVWPKSNRNPPSPAISRLSVRRVSASWQTKACWKRNIRPEQIDALLSKIVSEIESEYDREIPSVEIGNKAMTALRQLDKVAYVRFASVYRDFKDIEEFIAEIRTMGAKKR